MASINLREALNAISEVITNRPAPIREIDQIYMKAGDMLLQTEYISKVFDKKNIVFIGDGDAIGLSLVHLHNQGILTQGPSHIHLLDFDERIVLSIQKFAKTFSIANKISAELYNVADPLPEAHWQKYDGFYTNPPYGASNNGRSIEAFLNRGIEACKEDACCSLVIADHPDYPWTKTVLYLSQQYMLSNGFYIAQMIPEFHSYHLDDSPTLTSCSITFKRMNFEKTPYSSTKLAPEMLTNFYGEENPLIIKYIKDLTNGNKLGSKDYTMIKL